MINLRQRSYQKELMDGNDIPFEAMAQTLKELNIVNTRLGGHAITISGVRQLIKDKEKVSICEIGCGGGDNLFAIYKYCLKKNIPATFIGIDINPECIAFAKQQYTQLPCQWICSDYAFVNFENDRPDIIFSSLFCHHFTNEELVAMLKWQQQNSRKGFFINDLHRHPLAYYAIKMVTGFFSKSYLVKHDAPLSVLRGFRKREWLAIGKQAGLSSVTCQWYWAFRWLLICRK